MVAPAFAAAASGSKVNITEDTFPIHKLLNTQARQQIDPLLSKASAPNAGAEDKANYAATMFQLVATNQFAQMLADPPQSNNETAKIQKINSAVQDSLKNMAEVFEGLSEEGHAPSALMASQLYANGLGVTKDLNKAKDYANKALKGGVPQAQQLLDKLQSVEDAEKNGPKYKVLKVKPFRQG